MPQSLARIVVHIVFSTKYRYPYLVDKSIRNEMHAYIGGTCNELQCPVLTVGGVADHAHILFVLSRSLSIAKVVCDIKRGSSKWIKTKGGMLTKFAWQNGYAVFSVGQADVDRVRKYIEGRPEIFDPLGVGWHDRRLRHLKQEAGMTRTTTSRDGRLEKRRKPCEQQLRSIRHDGGLRPCAEIPRRGMIREPRASPSVRTSTSLSQP